MMTLKNLKLDLQKQSNKKKAKILQRFFKTGPGEYGEGDIFCGITVPVLRELSKKYQGLATRETLQLLKSKIHEQRLLSLFILILRYQKADLLEKEKIYKIYLKHSKYINNWDLIDLSAYHIVGSFLMDKNKAPIYRLAKSKSLWERRIAVLSTFCYIRNNKFNEMLRIARTLLLDKEDLIQKAVGWMLREIGKRDLAVEEEFLQKYYKKMPRTMLRYAIERFEEPKRKAYLKGVA